MLTVQKEGGRNVQRNIQFYNLDAIISVGYKVSSQKATMFRIWANSILKSYLVKGFALDDDKKGQLYTIFIFLQHISYTPCYQSFKAI
ncbi:RhuM family protein [Mariniflexile sp. HMF6888]|uniref:RhuM family protein n=1 Tax=Mariniflexile sp. HMF6888 TaxID=3373086 RepID=UPI0037A21322